MNRIKILNFLQWDDKNGSYTDDNSIIEGLPPLTYIEAIKMFICVIGELEKDYTILNITKEFKKNPIIKKALNILIEGKDNITTYKKVINIL